MMNENEIQFDDDSMIVGTEEINNNVLNVLSHKHKWKRGCQWERKYLNNHLNSKMHVSVFRDDQEWWNQIFINRDFQ